MKMKKLITLLLALAMVLSLAACGSKDNSNANNDSQGNGVTPTAATYKIKLGTTGNEEHQSTIAANFFKEKVEELTNGAVTVEIYPNSQLGSEREMAEGVKLGTLEMTILELAVGVVAAEADVDLIALRDDDVLHLAASVVADKVDVGILREQHIGHLEDRRDFLGCGNAELLLQFLNVLHGLGDVASGVADGEKLVVNNRLLGGLAVSVQGKCDFAVQDNILLNIFCYSTFLMKGIAKIRRGKALGGGRDKR